MAAPLSPTPSDTNLSNTPIKPIDWYELLDKMIGNNRQRFTGITVPAVGIPQPPRPPEELRVARFFETCTFKTTMSCAIGEKIQRNCCMEVPIWWEKNLNVKIACFSRVSF